MTQEGPMLLLLAGAYPQQGPRCIRQAKERGLRVWLTDKAEHLEAHPEIVAMADKATPLDYQDQAACVAWAVEQARQQPFIGVFGFREYSVESVAAVARELGLPGNPLEAVRLVRHKSACRQALRERGFAQPASVLCTDMEGARAFAAANQPGPWIVKPPGSMGSQGVSLVEGDGDWEAAFQNLGYTGAPFVVESFQHGPEFSAEGIFVHGEPHLLALTAKITTGAPSFVELGHTMPAGFDEQTARRAEAEVTGALRALGLRWGIFHVEFWVDRGQVVLGEVHVRPGGDYIHLMAELVTGVDLYGTVFDQLLGRPVHPEEWRIRQGAAVRFLTANPGRVEAVSGWDAVTSHPDCRVAELSVKPGNLIHPVRSWADRQGCILTVGKTAAEAAELAERLRSDVQITVSQASR